MTDADLRARAVVWTKRHSEQGGWWEVSCAAWMLLTPFGLDGARWWLSLAKPADKLQERAVQSLREVIDERSANHA